MAPSYLEVGASGKSGAVQSPQDHSVIIPEEIKGRVVTAWQISHRTANSSDYGISAQSSWDRLPGGGYRWPYALQPIRTWVFRNPPLFRELEGYADTTHTLRAVSSVDAVDEALSDSLRMALAAQGEEVDVLPDNAAITGAVLSLRQKHPFARKPFEVTPSADAIYRVYIATLGGGGRYLKIGHAQNAETRIEDFNKYRISNEAQWVLHTSQPIGTVEQAIEVEKRLGEMFARYRTERNNNEIYVGLSADNVLLAMASIRR
jgi:hypothetical protein